MAHPPEPEECPICATGRRFIQIRAELHGDRVARDIHMSFRGMSWSEAASTLASVLLAVKIITREAAEKSGFSHDEAMAFVLKHAEAMEKAANENPDEPGNRRAGVV